MNLEIKFKPAVIFTVIFKRQCIQKAAKMAASVPYSLTLEKTRSIAAELDIRRSSVSGVQRALSDVVTVCLCNLI